MEINKFDREITGVIVLANIVEGRFGIFTNHGTTHNFGSWADLPAFRVPATAEEAKRARHVITWAVDNIPFPRFTPLHLDWSLRKGGWDQTQNIPFSATVYLTNPGNQNDQTIPSGTPALAFGKGVYTFTDDDYIANNSLHNAGAMVIVANTAEDTSNAGKLKYQASFDDRVVGIVRQYDSATGNLTVEVNY